MGVKWFTLPVIVDVFELNATILLYIPYLPLVFFFVTLFPISWSLRLFKYVLVFHFNASVGRGDLQA